MKKALSIILSIVILFSLCACSDEVIEFQPKKDVLSYGAPDRSNGYSVSGNAYDLMGGTLAGVEVLVNGKTAAITDDFGHFEINALSGKNVISVSFYDYVFEKAEFEVEEQTDNLVFMGKPGNLFSVTATCSTLNGQPLYGIVYNVDTKEEDVVRERYDGKGYIMYNSGKTVITPAKTGFTFYPESATVYTSGAVHFTAIPNDDTMTVSGELDFSSTNSFQEVTIMVNGQRYTKSEVKMTSEGQKAYFTLYGLKADGSYQYITAGMGTEGSISENDYTLNAEKDDCTFIMRKAKNIRVNLKFPTGKDIPEGTHFYYFIEVYDEKGKNVLYEKVTNKKFVDAVDIWEGCKIVIRCPTGLFTSIHEEITEQFMDSSATEVDVRCTLS